MLIHNRADRVVGGLWGWRCRLCRLRRVDSLYKTVYNRLTLYFYLIVSLRAGAPVSFWCVKYGTEQNQTVLLLWVVVPFGSAIPLS